MHFLLKLQVIMWCMLFVSFKNLWKLKVTCDSSIATKPLVSHVSNCGVQVHNRLCLSATLNIPNSKRLSWIFLSLNLEEIITPINYIEMSCIVIRNVHQKFRHFWEEKWQVGRMAVLHILWVKNFKYVVLSYK